MHEIATLNSQPAMAIRSDSDTLAHWWHKVGNPLPEDADFETWFEASGFKALSPITRRRLYMSPFRGAPPTIELPDHYAIVAGTGKVLSIMSKGYIPTQPRDILEFYRLWCDAADAKMRSAAVLRGGKILYALADFRKGYKLSNGDEIVGNLLLSNSNDGTYALQAEFVQTVVVCMNTLKAAWSENRNGKGIRPNAQVWRMRHLRQFDSQVRAKARQALNFAVENLERSAEWANRLTQVRVDHEETMRFVVAMTGQQILEKAAEKHEEQEQDSSSLDSIIAATEDAEFTAKLRNLTPEDLKPRGRALLNAILEGEGAGSRANTAWGLVNGVTYFVDHGGKADSSRQASAWFGAGNQLKLKAANWADTRYLGVN